jgi:DNA mismatch repair protein MutL
MEKEGLIEILPEGVANQIAAGEVVQRPASAVKELLENAVDAEATSIELNIEDSGRTLIQVKDNGIGMSGRDLELAFERHATSKIKEAKDLFSLLTMGFRGEALASIAAVAQLTSHTKRAQDEIGWSIQIDGGKKKKSEQVATQNGTLINVRNLFFNIPARRNFLKSDAVEFRHISDEFHRVALSRPDISFRLIHNGTFDQRLVPVKEETPLLNIEGFVGKPEFARKTRGEQFLFVNNRYVRSHSLHYSILQAFEGLIGEGRHPAYFLKLDIDPKHIDINIHPTKTEIKFDDERSVFGLL